MIKKIIILTAIIVFTAVPIVMADAGPAPQPADGKLIDIVFSLSTDEIVIGEELAINVTVTNLTRHQVELTRMYFGIFSYSTDHDSNKTSVNEDELKLSAYESLTFEIKDCVDEYISWYKDGEYYYTDVYAGLNFWAGGYRDEDYYYEESESIIPLRINNLYDGSEMLEIRWIDNIENIYFYKKTYENYYDEGIPEIIAAGMVYYDVLYINNSEVKIGKAEPNEEYRMHDLYYKYEIFSELKSTYQQNISEIFEIDGYYYCVRAEREYSTKIIEVPIVDLNIDLIDEDGQGYFIYKLEITNRGNDTIENFMIMAADFQNAFYLPVSESIGTIKKGETVVFELTLPNDEAIDDLKAGYILDGMFFWWEISCIYTDDRYIDADTAVIDDENMNCYDYEYANQLITGDTYTEEPVYTVLPTNTPDIQQTTAAPDEPSAPDISVKDRKTPYIWAIVVVSMLIAAAIVMIAFTMKKIIEDKKNESD